MGRCGELFGERGGEGLLNVWMEEEEEVGPRCGCGCRFGCRGMRVWVCMRERERERDGYFDVEGGLEFGGYHEGTLVVDMERKMEESGGKGGGSERMWSRHG